MLKYLFIDESGDLGLPGSKYLVISCLAVDDQTRLGRIIKNARRYKFRKELKKACEIKANKSSPELKKHLLTKLNDLNDAEVSHIILEKKRIYSDYLRDNKHKLYNFVAGKLAKYMTVDKEKVVTWL